MLLMQIFECLTPGVTMGGGVAAGVDIGLGEVTIVGFVVSMHSLRLKINSNTNKQSMFLTTTDKN